MVEIVVPYDPDRGRRQMAAVILDEVGAQAGGPGNPLEVRTGLTFVPFRNTLGTNGIAAINGAFTAADTPTRYAAFAGLDPAPFPNTSAVLTWTFSGPVLALWYERGGNPIGLKIDGVGYDVPVSPVVRPADRSTAPNSYHHYSIIADDLGDGPHVVELTLLRGASGAKRNHSIFGYFVDSRFAPPPVQRGVNFFEIAPVTMTASEASGSTWKTFPVTGRGLRKVHFFNPKGASGPAQAYVRYTAANGTIWSTSIPPGGSADWDPGGLVYHDVFVQADLVGVVAAPIMGN